MTVVRINDNNYQKSMQIFEFVFINIMIKPAVHATMQGRQRSAISRHARRTAFDETPLKCPRPVAGGAFAYHIADLLSVSTHDQ